MNCSPIIYHKNIHGAFNPENSSSNIHTHMHTYTYTHMSLFVILSAYSLLSHPPVFKTFSVALTFTYYSLEEERRTIQI